VTTLKFRSSSPSRFFPSWADIDTEKNQGEYDNLPTRSASRTCNAIAFQARAGGAKGSRVQGHGLRALDAHLLASVGSQPTQLVVSALGEAYPIAHAHLVEVME